MAPRPRKASHCSRRARAAAARHSHLGVFNVQDGKAVTLGVVPLGDRVQLFRLWHEPGKVLLDIVEPGPG